MPPVELVKEKDLWRVKSLWDVPADVTKVNHLLEKLSTAKGELRGNEKKLFEDFKIKNEDAFSMVISGDGGKVLLDLKVGTKQAGMQGCFLRQTASDEVYFSDVNMADLLGIYTPLEEGKPSSDYWADLTLFKFQPENVQKITVFQLKNGAKTGAAGIELVTDKSDPTKNSWKFLRQDLSSSIDPDKVIRFIATLNSIKAKNVVDPDGKGYGLEKPVLEIAVTAGGKETAISLGVNDEKAGGYYAKISDASSIFLVNGYYFGDLNIDDTHFFKESQPPADSQKTKMQELNAAGQAS